VSVTGGEHVSAGRVPHDPPSRRVPALTTGLVALACWLLLAYLSLALIPERWPAVLRAWWALAGAALLGLWAGLYVVLRRRPMPERLLRIATVSGATALALLVVDQSYAAWERAASGSAARPPRADAENRDVTRDIRRYYPTERNFQIYRPNASAAGFRYGDLASDALLQSSRLFAAVAERRYETFRIDAHGFRDTSPFATSEIFALGDSYTFGSTDQPRIWVERLEALIGRPVYNLGITGASPLQELLILQHVLASGARPRHVIWMLIEANDLDDDYDPPRRLPSDPDAEGPLDLVRDAVRDVRDGVRGRSLLRRALTGDLVIRTGRGSPSPADPLVTEARRRRIPLYQSPQLGYKLFHPAYVERAARSEVAVQGHPNRPRLERVFADMRALATRAGFHVTVVVAPSDARLYAPRFAGLQGVSDEPYLIRYLAALARRHDFEGLNLYPLLRPYAERELLYWRDDTHWNDRGHELVAQLIAEHVFEPTAGRRVRGCERIPVIEAVAGFPGARRALAISGAMSGPPMYSAIR